jgi:hypothetical protein
MTQHQVTHAANELLPACLCGRTPKHFEDRRAARSGGGHCLECHPCDRKTAKHPSFEAALQEWCRLVGVPMPTPKKQTSITRIRANQ